MIPKCGLKEDAAGRDQIVEIDEFGLRIGDVGLMNATGDCPS
jgi:hypothetical protein